jgi:aminoglycoside 3-N-acetyltransferase
MNSQKDTKRLGTILSKQDIKTGLSKLELETGDVVGVHSSLSSLGYVEDGANTVIDALLEVVGTEGTVVMPTHSANLQEVERTPEELAAGVSWLLKILPYDPETTPCTTGAIPETFRKRRGVLRSLHTVHSVAVAGPKAQEIAEAGKKGALEAWRKLLEYDGYILLIGIDLRNCTAMHLVEERVTLPKHLREKLTPPKWFVQKHPPDEWEWDVGPYPQFAKMTQPCIEHGIMKTTKVGNATLRLAKLKDLLDLYEKYMKENPDQFYSA